jgi:putative transposase
MRTYKRAKIQGGCYFFTVNLANRQGNTLLVQQVAILREAFRRTQEDHPFKIDAIVIMPDHLHCIWSLPEGDDNYPMRWSLIKARFSRQIKTGEAISKSRQRKGERNIWQRRYWEHVIRDDEDYFRHVDYIHYNPVKHGHTEVVKDWPHSSFQRWVEKGAYSLDWGEAIDEEWE